MQCSELSYKARPDPANQTGRPVTSDLRRAALHCRQGERMEEVGVPVLWHAQLALGHRPLLFQKSSSEPVELFGHLVGVGGLLFAANASPNQAPSQALVQRELP